jgi:hypothetical protein
MESTVADAMTRDPGIITGRDIAIGVVADVKGCDTPAPDSSSSSDLTTVSASQPLDEAGRLMREKAVRRLPVLDGDRLVGVVSLGELGIEKDARSAVADISAAPPNRQRRAKAGLRAAASRPPTAPTGGDRREDGMCRQSVPRLLSRVLAPGRVGTALCAPRTGRASSDRDYRVGAPTVRHPARRQESLRPGARVKLLPPPWVPLVRGDATDLAAFGPDTEAPRKHLMG